jgi:hypothetical protein
MEETKKITNDNEDVEVSEYDNNHHHPDCQCDRCVYGDDAAKWLFNPSEY